MNCPVCKGKTRVLETRLHLNGRRKRECLECLTWFYTYEKIDFNSLPDYILAKSELEAEKKE